jgi:N-acetylmuramoyl-L-alanine amidase
MRSLAAKALILLTLPALAWSATLKVGSRVFSVADTSFEATPYIGIDALDSLLGASGQWIPDRQKWVLKESVGPESSASGKTRNWVFTLDNAFCSIGDRIFNLTYPVRRGPQKLYVPLHPMLRLLKSEAKHDVTVTQILATSHNPGQSQGQSQSQGQGQAAAPETTSPASVLLLGPVQTEARSNGTLVTVQATASSQPEIFFVPPNYLVRFNRAKVAPGTPLRQAGAGLVQKVLLTSDSGQVQLTLQMRGNVDTVEAEPIAGGDKSGGHGWQFLVRKPTKVTKETHKSAKTALTDKTARKGTIILDPGHGGHDQGAHVGGIHEAKITLAVGKLLKAELEKRGYKALLTRDDDRYVSLADRPKFASENAGDLFISLHCNAIDGSHKRKKQVSGYVAYILREGASEEDNALARRENQAVQAEKGKTDKTEISPVDWILLEHQLNLYSKQSEDFTEKLIHSFEDFDLPKYGTGASQAGFFVLVGAYMPAVLFEMGFLTNDRDRAFMADKKGQKRIAIKLAEAIDRFMSYRKEG